MLSLAAGASAAALRCRRLRCSGPLLWLQERRRGQMAKSKGATILVKLLSSAGTGFFYVKKKNPKTLTQKLAFVKYDPRVRKHVLFSETKLK